MGPYEPLYLQKFHKNVRFNNSYASSVLRFTRLGSKLKSKTKSAVKFEKEETMKSESRSRKLVKKRKWVSGECFSFPLFVTLFPHHVCIGKSYWLWSPSQQTWWRGKVWLLCGGRGRASLVALKGGGESVVAEEGASFVASVGTSVKLLWSRVFGFCEG